MHDTAALEENGLATAFVASEVFEDAAAAQAKSLGTTPGVVLIPHPIQDRTDAEIVALADQALDQIVSTLTQ